MDAAGPGRFRGRNGVIVELSTARARKDRIPQYDKDDADHSKIISMYRNMWQCQLLRRHDNVNTISTELMLGRPGTR